MSFIPQFTHPPFSDRKNKIKSSKKAGSNKGRSKMRKNCETKKENFFVFTLSFKLDIL